MFEASFVLRKKRRQFRWFPIKYGHWELAILHNSDSSRTFLNWKARAILRLWVLNKRGCYFWHSFRDWLLRPDKLFYDLLLLLSISSAALQSAIPLVDDGHLVTRSICGYTPNLLWRTPKPMRIGGVSLVKINIERCDTSRLTLSARTVAKNGNIYINCVDLNIHFRFCRSEVTPCPTEECPGVDNKRNFDQAPLWTRSSGLKHKKRNLDGSWNPHRILMQKNSIYFWSNIWHCIVDHHSGENLV